MTADTWTAEVIGHERVMAFTRVALRGPELDEHDRDLIDRLASTLFDEFCEYVAARNAMKIALEKNGEIGQYELDRVATTWDALVGEIDSGLLLSLADGRLVAQVLDETAGRVGIEGQAA
ncbi:MAG: hypothetical protein HOW97_24380 [Catenulispora sp.]|nr:hypothetical protein [Catenulispora sp.]